MEKSLIFRVAASGGATEVGRGAALDVRGAHPRERSGAEGAGEGAALALRVAQETARRGKEARRGEAEAPRGGRGGTRTPASNARDSGWRERGYCLDQQLRFRQQHADEVHEKEVISTCWMQRTIAINAIETALDPRWSLSYLASVCLAFL